MGLAVGIDLGTTFSAVAHFDQNGRAAIIPNAEGSPITPSVIDLSTNPPTVGSLAKAAQAAGSDSVVAFFKRNMGNPNFSLQANGRKYTPVDLSALVLAQLKADAQAALGRPVTDAVITVPAYFHDNQRRATIEAGQIAGLNVLRIINEPTAAALAYGFRQSVSDEDLLVYDLGGGTFDVTVVKISQGGIDVLATDGDHNLGGKDWDDRIARDLGERFREEHGVDPLDEPLTFNDLLVRVENAKKALSSRYSVDLAIDYQGQRATYTLTRERFEELTADLMERTRHLTEKTLEAAGISWAKLAGVLPVGGSTRMPMVHRYVQEMSGRPPRTGVNVDEAVALGAAIQAAIDFPPALGGKSRAESEKSVLGLPGVRAIRDVMSHSMGMIAESPDRSRYLNCVIVPRNKPIPAKETRPFRFRTGPGENTCEVYVTQGESESPRECLVLGKYTFSGIPHQSAEAAVLDITYSYDRNGVVEVSGVDKASGKALELKVDPLPADMGWLHRPPPPAPTLHATIVLLIDVSGSMSGAPLDEAKIAAGDFVSKSDLTHASIGLSWFGTDAGTVTEPIQDARRILQAIDSLRISGGTNMSAGLRVARSQLVSRDEPRYIVLLTDGCPNSESETEREAKVCREAGIDLVAVGTGGANHAFLKRIAVTDAAAVFAHSGKVSEAFSNIAQAITEGGGARIRGGLPAMGRAGA
jgi:molecular chaperone DnaK